MNSRCFVVSHGKLCADIKPGEGRINTCVKSHWADLSEACQDRMLTAAITGKVCKGDLTKLCAGIVPGTPAVSELV
jgi:hypothetical protein